NITFYIDTATMELTEGTAPYNSHSFNQRVKADATGIYFADHGDAYPRCISLSRHHLDDTPPVRTSVLDIVGEIGDNVTGATLGDMMLSTNKVIITGNSVPQNHTVCGQSGSDGQRNIYLAVTDKATFDVEFKWLTENDPSGNISVGSPRMVQIAEDKFVILYNEFDGEKHTLCCILIDGEGNVIKTKRYEGVFFADNSEPIFYNGDIIWISPLTSSLLTTENYIFRLPHTDLIVLENINIAQDEYNLILGEYVTVDVTFEPKEATGNELTWSFDKEGVAQYVDGKVLGIGAGSTTLTVSCGELSDSCIINVDGDNRAEYVVRYYIDGEKYTEKRLGYGLVPENIEVPEKAGFVFSGWKDLPETMPAYDIDVHGEYISAVKIGDVNQDGTVNTADAVCILKHAAQLEILEGNALIAADTNIDGTVNTADAVVILKYSAGMIELP
ncbi:MAG: dockerin type I repeat-containing protein, partial [Clostridia bacterium]|nr:dockerin type I repeat-containing protein [Clostridia bacterium]